jgi:hypothetical protein
VRIGDKLLRREALVPLRHISTNLRHAINPVLNLIVEEINNLDPTLSIRRIDPSTKYGRVVAATVIIDMFVQMITSVNEFRPSSAGFHQDRQMRFCNVIRKYHGIYSILKNVRRNPNLGLVLQLPETLCVEYSTELYEYLVSILMDNAWKYSKHNTGLTVRSTIRNSSKVDIEFINTSAPLPLNVDIFSKGYKADEHSDGFGYGLHWARILTDFYNHLHSGLPDGLEISHRQVIVDNGEATQVFTLHNVDFTERR